MDSEEEHGDEVDPVSESVGEEGISELAAYDGFEKQIRPNTDRTRRTPK